MGPEYTCRGTAWKTSRKLEQGAEKIRIEKILLESKLG